MPHWNVDPNLFKETEVSSSSLLGKNSPTIPAPKKAISIAVKIIVGLTHQEASAIKLAIMLREDIHNIGKAKPKGIRKVNHRLFLKDLFFSFWDKSIKRQIQIPKQTKKDKKPRAKSIIIFVRGSLGAFILELISFIFTSKTPLILDIRGNQLITSLIFQYVHHVFFHVPRWFLGFLGQGQLILHELIHDKQLQPSFLR